MATTVEEILLQVKSADAAKNVADLNANIKLLKKALQDVEATEEENQKTVALLKQNQDALRDAMHNTGATAEDLLKSSEGLVDVNGRAIGSYNDLVHKMADLKAAWRATTDEVERQKLGTRINELNDALKDLDADVGNFQRNVGNYTSVWKDTGGAIKKLTPALGGMTDRVEGLSKSMGILSKNPLMGVLVLLLPVLQAIAGALKDNETATATMKKLMDALKPVTEFFGAIIEKIAGWLGKVVDWVIGYFPKFAPILSKVVSSITGVGNAVLQYLLTPVRTAIEAFKGLGNIMRDVFKGDFSKIKEDAETAFSGIQDAFKKGVSFKKNFEVGKEAGEGLIAGIGKGVKGKGEGGSGESATSIGEEIAKNIAKGMAEIDKFLAEGFEQDILDTVDDVEEAMKSIQDEAAGYAKGRLGLIEKNAKEELKWNSILTEDDSERARKAFEIQQNLNLEKLDLLRQFADEAMANGDGERLLEYQQKIADLEVEIAQNTAAEEKRLAKETADVKEAEVKRIIGLYTSYSATIGSLIGNIASFYEADEKNAERNAKKVKAMKIAEATMSTLSGVATAIAGAFTTKSGPWDIALAAIQAATIAAGGAAQIAKIKSTDISGTSASPSSVSAVASAPSMPLTLPETRNITSQSEEDRLNQMASTSKVYILQSDIEASNNASKVRVEESSF